MVLIDMIARWSIWSGYYKGYKRLDIRCHKVVSLQGSWVLSINLSRDCYISISLLRTRMSDSNDLLTPGTTRYILKSSFPSHLGKILLYCNCHNSSIAIWIITIISMHNRISLILSDTARNTVKGPLRTARVMTQQAPMGAAKSKFLLLSISYN